MNFRQLFDSVSGTYSYLIASRRGAEALIIDPVLEKVERYIQLLNELDLRLVKAVDTHLHADHITGLGALRDRTRCITVMGEQTKADVVSMRVADGEMLEIEGTALNVLYTPGHTDDSYSFVMGDRVFTGDTLPHPRHRPQSISRTATSRAQYEIFGRLLCCRTRRMVPAHARATPSRPSARKGVQPAPAGEIDRRICRLMNNLKARQSQDDGRGDPRQHPVGLAQEEIARARLAPEPAAGEPCDRPRRHRLDRSARAASATATVSPARSTRPMATW
jgi:glyoxylase-like metal-dependent hydrolase (beta-lactamase superfamily II)